MAREMTEAEERYLMHAVGHDPLIASYLNNQIAHGQNFMKTAASLPVCPRCESAALYHERGILCPSCSYSGPAAHRIRTHLREGIFR